MRSLHKVLKPGQIVSNGVKVGIYQEPEPDKNTSGEAGSEETGAEEGMKTYALISEEKRKILEHAREQGRQSAARILEEAYAQRDKIVNMASEESFRIKTQAHNEGYEAGLRRAEEEIRQGFSSIERSISRMEQDLNQYQDETEQKMIELALHMMEKILKKRIEEDETVLMEMAEKAILSERDKNNIIVHLSDSTMELINVLEERLKPLMTNNGHVGTIKLKPDNVPPGTVQIETEEGIVDASVEVQIANLKKQLASLGGQPQAGRDEYRAD